jgi:hypothetical protein
MISKNFYFWLMMLLMQNKQLTLNWKDFNKGEWLSSKWDTNISMTKNNKSIKTFPNNFKTLIRMNKNKRRKPFTIPKLQLLLLILTSMTKITKNRNSMIMKMPFVVSNKSLVLSMQIKLSKSLKLKVWRQILSKNWNNLTKEKFKTWKKKNKISRSNSKNKNL